MKKTQYQEDLNIGKFSSDRKKFKLEDIRRIKIELRKDRRIGKKMLFYSKTRKIMFERGRKDLTKRIRRETTPSV